VRRVPDDGRVEIGEGRAGQACFVGRVGGEIGRILSTVDIVGDARDSMTAGVEGHRGPIELEMAGGCGSPQVSDRGRREELLPVTRIQGGIPAGRWADNRLAQGVDECNVAPAAARRTTGVRAPLCDSLGLGVGAILTPKTAAALQALAPQTRIAHILGAGHSIRRGQFVRYMATVSAFLVESSS
jgi:hypothetical protein